MFSSALQQQRCARLGAAGQPPRRQPHGRVARVAATASANGARRKGEGQGTKQQQKHHIKNDDDHSRQQPQQQHAWPGANTNGRHHHHASSSAASAMTVPLPGSVVPKYRRIMLKVSGEALAGSAGFGIDPQVVEHTASEIRAARAHGIEVAVVVGGGNYFRGASSWPGLERATGDYVGMLATVMNALCLQAALESVGVTSRVQTAIEMREVAEPYIRRRAIRHLEAGHVVIFGAGTGNPYFTTDTAAALRAAEVQAEVFLKATKVDGVYTHDPVKHPDKAVRYERLSYRQVANDELGVMDGTAVTLCKENNIPVIVFNAMQPGNVLRAALGEDVGTVVSHADSSLEAPTRIVIEAAAGAGELSDIE